MEQQEQVNASMPPPQTPGYSMKRGIMEALAQQTSIEAKRPLQQITNDTEAGTAAECPGLDSTPSFDALPTHTQATNSFPTIWQDCLKQMMKELETSGQTWAVQLRKLHEEETAALATIHDLNKNAQEMNICFHQQLDSLHNTVVDVVSYFKK
ncbi:hypothetical protein Pmani_003976 [Petrolisthes manimaculis]|uniref:Uncharacterized protein n=1 Tax=Petrolisthes manimaculis TaxID=1843537 RepID=A0AAE1QEL6_9EUCA|nr:hypothetical protein Pmani_003976 [Petrolisthes manimaculis]